MRRDNGGREEQRRPIRRARNRVHVTCAFGFDSEIAIGKLSHFDYSYHGLTFNFLVSGSTFRVGQGIKIASLCVHFRDTRTGARSFAHNVGLYTGSA